VVPRVFRAPEGPAAREARRPHFVRRRASKPGQALPPPTGTAAWPSGPSGALHTSGARSRTCDLVLYLEARPGPATAHGHRSLARGRYDPDPPRTSSCLPSITFEAATLWLPKNVARNSPAISSNFEFMSLELQRFRVVSKNDRGKLRAKFIWARSAALRGVRCRCDNAWPAGDTTPIRPARPLACLPSLSKRLHRGCPKMSHVIPLRLVQILNSRRWNCNVFRWSRKMTEGNYVRNLAGGAAATGIATRNMGATACPAPLRSPPRRWWWGFAALGAGCRRVAGVLYL